MTRWPHTTLRAVAAVACVLTGPAWSNGDHFFRFKEIPGKPEFVIFGSVKDDRGHYLDNATVFVIVMVHQLEFTATTDALGRFRTPDVGRAIEDLGYETDPSLIEVTVNYPGYRVVRREYRGKYRQKKGAIEMNFLMSRGAQQTR
jgi:hypothetical protein